MTDQVPDSGQGAPETQAPPVPAFSPASDGAPTSGKTFDEDALVGKIVERIGPEIDRRFQSAKDKRFKTLDQLGDVAPLVEFKQYLDKAQGNYDAALREYKVDQLLNQTATAVSPAPQGNGRQVDTTVVQNRTAEILTEAGIDYADPEYTALAGKTYRSPDDFYHQVNKMVAKRLKQGKPPTVAAAAGGDGGAIPGSADKDTKLSRLYAENAAAQKRGDIQAVKALAAEIRSLGGVA